MTVMLVNYLIGLFKIRNKKEEEYNKNKDTKKGDSKKDGDY